MTRPSQELEVARLLFPALFFFFFPWAGGGKSHGQSEVLCWAVIVGQAGPIWAAAGGQLLSHEGNCSSLGLNGVGTSQDQPLCAGCLEHVTLGTTLCLWTSYLTSLSPFSTSMNVGWGCREISEDNCLIHSTGI